MCLWNACKCMWPIRKWMCYCVGFSRYRRMTNIVWMAFPKSLQSPWVGSCTCPPRRWARKFQRRKSWSWISQMPNGPRWEYPGTAAIRGVVTMSLVSTYSMWIFALHKYLLSVYFDEDIVAHPAKRFQQLTPYSCVFARSLCSVPMSNKGEALKSTFHGTLQEEFHPYVYSFISQTPRRMPWTPWGQDKAWDFALASSTENFLAGTITGPPSFFNRKTFASFVVVGSVLWNRWCMPQSIFVNMRECTTNMHDLVWKWKFLATSRKKGVSALIPSFFDAKEVHQAMNIVWNE